MKTKKISVIATCLWLCFTPTTLRADTIVQNINFNNRPVGTYMESMMRSDWSMSSTSNNGVSEGRVKVVEIGGNKVLQVKYPKGYADPVNGGAQWKAPLPPRDEYYSEYQVMFNSNFEWVKGGKIPGLVGGTAPTGGKNSDHGMSARYMWRNNPGGKAILYLYWPGQKSTFGDEIVFGRTFSKGVWHTLKQRIKLNTPGLSNGIIQVWFDGTLVYSNTNYNLRTSGDIWKIDKFYFSSFFGGNAPLWSAVKDEYIYFDNFRIWYP
jgi:hypothetical protein